MGILNEPCKYCARHFIACVIVNQHADHFFFGIDMHFGDRWLFGEQRMVGEICSSFRPLQRTVRCQAIKSRVAKARTATHTTEPPSTAWYLLSQIISMRLIIGRQSACEKSGPFGRHFFAAGVFGAHHWVRSRVHIPSAIGPFQYALALRSCFRVVSLQECQANLSIRRENTR
jgi:hypothetical protein